MSDKLTRSNSSKAVKGLVKETPPSPSKDKKDKDKEKEKKAKLTRSNSSTSVKDGVKKEIKEESLPEAAPEAAPSNTKSAFLPNLFGKKKTLPPPSATVGGSSSARNRSQTSSLGVVPPSTSVTTASPRAEKEKKEDEKKKNRKSIGDKKSRPKSTAFPSSSETLSSISNKQSESEKLPALTYDAPEKSPTTSAQEQSLVPALSLPVPRSASTQPSPVSPTPNSKKPPARSNSLRSLKNLLKKDPSPQPSTTSHLSSGSSPNVALPKDPSTPNNTQPSQKVTAPEVAPETDVKPALPPVGSLTSIVGSTAELAPYNAEAAAAASGAAKAAKSVVKAESGLDARTNTTRPELQRSNSASILMTGLTKSGYKDVAAVSVAVKKARRLSVDDTNRKVDEFKSRGVGASDQKEDQRELPTTDEFNEAFAKAQKAARRMSQTMLMSGFGMSVKPRKPKGPSTAMKPYGAGEQEGTSEELVLYKEDGPDISSKIGNVLALAGKRAKKMSLTALLNSAVGFNKFTNMFLGMTDELDELELEEEEGINPYMFFDPNAKFLPEEAESLTPDSKARNKVINELIKTEREYVRDLEFLHARFIVPLKAQEIIAEELVTSMFSGLSIISALHKELLYDLIKQVLNSKGEVVGPIFVKMGAFLKMYAQYCGNQNQIIEQYNATLKKHSSFEKFVHEKENHELGRPLTTFLTKPYIRICTYASYLSRLLRATPDTHPDHTALKTALGQIEQVSVALNEITKKVESGHATYDVWNKLVDGDKFHLWDDKSRLYLKEGLVKELDNDERRPREVYLVLFNNLLIKTEQKSDGKLQVKGGVPLDKAVLTINDDDALMQNYFTLTYYPPGRSFKSKLIVICSDRVEKKEWIDFLKQIVQVKEKAQSPDAPTAITLTRPAMTLVPLNTGQPGMGVGGPVKLAGGPLVMPKVDAAYTANSSISTILASFTAKQTIANLTAAPAKHQADVKKPDPQ
eukprot:TRINITY_DN2363_c0_g2_i2.p1 TRINITY_DN2363_c0_g2~~TRINITY_DN2363_c0_g2_i2.p1  ORF type:complete len:994 (-),score=266.60 TRINITY_DN2363_c0_g2_i2:365-3286(-)